MANQEHITWDYCENGLDASIEKDEANEIIEEIINIMRKHRITVKASKQLLTDVISSIENETVIT